MGKKAAGKQKQKEKPASAGTEHFAQDQTTAIPLGDNFQSQTLFNTSAPVENHEWAASLPVQSNEFAWPAATNGGGQQTWPDAGPGAWGEVGQEADNLDDGESAMLQPPPPRTHLPTIHEQASSGEMEQHSTANSEFAGDQDYDDDYQAQDLVQDLEMPQSRTGGTTAVPSAMGSPSPQKNMPPSPAAVAAAMQQTSKNKTSSASEAARKFEERKARMNTPSSRQLEIPGNTAPAHQPMSSASAQAALYESSTSKRRSAPTNPPGNTSGAGIQWRSSPPLFPGANPPGRISPDPSWTMTGGNAWSNQRRPGGGWVPGQQESGWEQENRKFQRDRAAQQQQQQPQPQPQSFYSQPQPQPAPTHQRHYSHPGPQPQRQGQNASWQGWGKEKLDQSDETVTDAHDEAANWNSQHQHNTVGATWGQYTYSNQGDGPQNHHKRKKDDWGEHNTAGAAWGQYSHSNQGDGPQNHHKKKDNWGEHNPAGAAWGQYAYSNQVDGPQNHHKKKDNWGEHNPAGAAWGQYAYSNQGDGPQNHHMKKDEADWAQHNTGGAAWGQSGHSNQGGAPQNQRKKKRDEADWTQYDRASGQNGGNWQSGNESHWPQRGQDHGGGGAWEQPSAPGGGGGSGWDQHGGNTWGQTGGGNQASGGEWDHQQPESTWPETQNHNPDPVRDTNATWVGHSAADWANDIKSKVTTIPHEGVGGSRNALSPGQRSQILNSLLNQSQSKDPKSTQQAYGTKQTKQQSTVEQEHWGAQDTGWGDDDESDEYDEDGRRVRFSQASNVWAGSPHTPSKTITHAQISPTLLSDLSKSPLHESKGTAFENVRHAFFGNARPARERFHWSFPANKDERVAAVLGWMQRMAPHIGKYGLLQFCQTREKGGIFINAAFRLQQYPNVPAFDYLTFDHLRSTMDKTLQESVAFYNPSVQAIVFVYLPSQSGNSVAIWRRKINVPEEARMQYQADINAISRTLRKDKEYVCYVDELPKKKSGQLRKPRVAVKANAKLAPLPAPLKKKKKWWKFFLS